MLGMFEGQQRGQYIWGTVSERVVGALGTGETGGRLK